jgi:hypothetical protein
MEKESYLFIPAAGAPTVKKIRKFIYQIVGVMTFAAMIAIFSRETIWQAGVIFLIWLLLCASVFILVSTNMYVIEVRINPTEGMLYFSFMNYKGEVDHKEIDIKQAKYSYKLRATKTGGYGLTMQGNDAKLQIGETTSENKHQTNVYFRNQLDEMNRIILQVKAN